MSRVNDQKIDVVLIDLLADQVRQATIAGCALISVVGIVTWFSFPPEQVLLWVLIGYAIAVPRYLVIGREKGRSAHMTSRSRLELVIGVALFVSALHWGAAGWLFLDPDDVQDFALICGAILGVIASALAIFSTRPRICCLFTFTVFAIVSVKLAVTGDWGLAIMCLVVLPTYAFLSVTLGNRIKVSITQDFRNAELLEEVRAARDAAEKASREKSLFMTATSHDLRQPLHAQSMILQIMNSRAQGTDLADLVDKMTVSNEALITLFNALLEVSQLDAGTIEARASHHLLSDLCHSIIEEFRETASEKNLTIDFIGPECVVYSDPILLMRIIRNLVSNALKFTTEGGINIKLNLDGEHVIASVCDTGIGIPEREKNAIFGEYVQLDNPSRDRSKGIGLGLALVRRMCELLDHDIQVESTVGVGSCFHITIPAGETGRIVALEKQSVSHVIQNLDILIIDDEKTILEAMEALFSEWACRTKTFTTLESAIQTIDEQHYCPDLIISDYRLGEGRNGVEAIADLRKQLKIDVPAILISGDTDPRLLEKINKENFYLLHKPVNIAKLRKVIVSLIPSQIRESDIR